MYNLTAEALVTTPEDAGSFALYTNSTKLGVTIVSDAEESGTVTLADAETGNRIRYAAVSGRSAVCEFTAPLCCPAVPCQLRGVFPGRRGHDF